MNPLGMQCPTAVNPGNLSSSIVVANSHYTSPPWACSPTRLPTLFFVSVVGGVNVDVHVDVGVEMNDASRRVLLLVFGIFPIEAAVHSK